ncbi:YitT family protein [Populibacterium corticicola]|uniref:YitT family protein n=1 Tax=Populibacterium corticicola TaxID=1812826 RepID=A0ABW5XEV0_9MICO
MTTSSAKLARVGPSVTPPDVATERSARPARQGELAHTAIEDVFGIASGILVVGFALYLLRATGAVTGGIAGLALAVEYWSGVSVTILIVVLNIPFVFIAWWQKGWRFTLRTLICIAGIAVTTQIMGHVLLLESINPVFGALTGNLLAGLGMLMLFRHNSSLGGVSITGLVIQERTGFKAGYTQLIFDCVVVAISCVSISGWMVLLSVCGAVILNLVIVLNHRPDRYIGY